MKKNIGSVLGLYPMPLVTVGAMVEGKPNWVLFEMPTYEYLRTGDVIGSCMKMGKE